MDLPLLDRVTIEPMGLSDLDQVLAIEQVSFKRPWTREGFITEMKRLPAVCLVAREGVDIRGHLVFWRIVPEIHLLNIAVAPLARCQGVGWFLMSYMIEFAKKIGGTDVFLEVRPSNTGALNLYTRCGFKVTGRRKNYYAEEKEDALLMTLTL